MELSKKDRLFLYNQYEILKKLSEDEDVEYYETQQEIVINGYKHDYCFLTEGFGDELDESASNLVWDVLQMYRALNNTYLELPQEEKEDINPEDLQFAGFDGNDEAEYYMYCDFVINKLKRYQESCKDGKRDFNTHWPILETYKNMLKTWKSISPNPYTNPTKEQLLRVLKSK